MEAVGVVVPVTISGVRLRFGVGELGVVEMVWVGVAVARVSGANERAMRPAQ